MADQFSGEIDPYGTAWERNLSPMRIHDRWRLVEKSSPLDFSSRSQYSHFHLNGSTYHEDGIAKYPYPLIQSVFPDSTFAS